MLDTGNCTFCCQKGLDIKIHNSVNIRARDLCTVGWGMEITKNKLSQTSMALSVSKTREKIQFNKKIINSNAQLQEKW